MKFVGVAASLRALIGHGDVVRLLRLAARSLTSTAWLLGFAALLLIWQTALFWLVLDGTIELDAYAGVDLFWCFLLGFLLWRAGVPSNQYYAALQMLGWATLAGPFGALVAIALTLPASASSLPAISGGADGIATDPSAGKIERIHNIVLDGRGRIEGAHRIRPLTDVIVEGSQPEKLEALSIAYRRYEPKLSYVLRRALKDHDTSVRVLAATVIAKLHAVYSRQIGDRRSAAVSCPNLAQSWRELAMARLAYADSRLLEGSRARTQVESAIADLEHAVELEPADAVSLDCLDRARRLLAIWRT